jgi:hypothetical protein
VGEKIGEPGLGIDIVELGSADEGIDQGGAFASGL